MKVTDAVVWTGSDFALAAALVLGIGSAMEGAVRVTRSRPYRAGVAVALAAAVLLVWINGAVGIIGDEDHPGNAMFGGVLAIAALGAVTARLRPQGMARALVATALAQAAVAAIALLAGMASPASGPFEIGGLSAGFTALWLASAWFFRRSAREQAYSSDVTRRKGP